MIFDIVLRSELVLKETAEKLGILLNSEFTFDESGYFKEFPAYETTIENTHIAVLGQEVGESEDLDIYQIHIHTENEDFDIFQFTSELRTAGFEILDDE